MPDSKTDWFVVAGAISGDGSLEKPFHDPWLAFRCAAAGDIIHIAAGTYFGRYDRSSWIVDRPNLTVLGGYSRDFSSRAPWQTPTVFAVFSGYEYTRENNLLNGHDDHSGLVLDGLFFDASGRNTYGDKPVEGIRSYPTMDGPIASFNAKEVTIRNCVFANSAAGGIELSGDGSRFENNLVLNMIGIGMLDLRSAMEQTQPITVINNTFAFAHDLGPPCGTGGDRAIGIRVNRPAVIRDNVFIGCGNAAIALYRDPDRVSIDGNLFYQTPRDVVNSRISGNTAEITENNIDEMEDMGLKSAADNIVQNPGITGFRPEWLDAYTRHLLGNYVKPPRDAANAIRNAAGLPALAPSDLEKEESKGDFAPRLSASDALALRLTAKQGYHTADLAVEIAPQPAKVVPSYSPIDWNVIGEPDASLANQRVELRVGLGFEQNSYLLKDADSTTHMGIRIYQPGTDDGSIFVLARRNTLPNRQFEEAIKYTNGREVESTYLLHGVYRTDIDPPNFRQKVTLVIESIVPAPFVPVAEPARPQGRDWFVKAGASGGDGSREKPFRDPFQALDKVEGGDTIHVAGGAYFGKLRSGKWKLLIRNLALLGGYNADFTERDPWKNPTRFVLDGDERAKGTPDGTVLSSEELSDGLILDGFIFDGATYNGYSQSGALDLRNSPLATLVDLRGSGKAPVTVRNCLFLNASGAAVSIASPDGVFENNVILNTSGWSLKIRGDGPGPWVIRNNSVLFACDPTQRAGTGQSSSDGTLFQLNGRAVTDIDSNIFAFGDNYGVRSATVQQNVSYDKNVFAANLYNHLTDAQYLWIDNSNWERRAVVDSGFASVKGNTLELPKLPVDPAFADAVLTRLFALPSRISAEEWKNFAAQIGSSVKPESPSDAPAAEPAKPAPAAPVPSTGPASLSDLLSSLSSMKSQIKEIESHKPEPSKVAEPVYCPAYDWQKAIALARDESVAGPGAHTAKLAVSFAAAQSKPSIAYTPITSQAIDADHASLDNQPVELEVTEARSSYANPSWFPSGTTSDDYSAYTVATAGDTTRTRIAIVVRLDTAVSKLLDRTVPTDKLRIRGTARVPGNPSALSIVVDSAEAVES